MAETHTAVCYWASQSQLLKSMTSRQEQDSPQQTCMTEDEEEDEYVTLYAKHHATAMDSQTKYVLESSDYYPKYLASMVNHSHNAMGEFLFGIAQTWAVSKISQSLVHRLTIPGIEWNWKTQTLRSFLEVMCFIAVTSASYQAYSNILLALQIGTLFGMAMCLCDDVVLLLLKEMTNHVFLAALRHPTQTSIYDMVEQPLVPFKTIVFGWLGWTSIRMILHFQSSIHKCVITIVVVGILCFGAGEIFCLWIPTRRIGLTIQNRWLKMRMHWGAKPTRSSVESITWTLCCAFFSLHCYRGQLSLVETLYWCMVVGMGISVVGGLDDDDPVKDFKWRRSDAAYQEDAYMRCDDYSITGLVSALFLS